MAGFQFELVTPEKLTYSGVVVGVVVPGTEGDFEVMAGHSPLMATVRPGIVSIREGAGAPIRLYVRGGFAEVTPDHLTLLAEQAVPVEEVTAEVVKVEIQQAEVLVEAAVDDPDKMVAIERLTQIKEVTEILRR